ncbi:hypothetical protein IRZ71_20130 [Flavobacterium sp. ANB]|uniref:hypothetical protein n=1 Tax=unclassified Flavobacterium TaxID=196869 RepID=UPI0012B81176|nr:MULTISPECIES: hypothetical protein [unclassified Flavobacterium]MBF4518670.1 hypothetical protein [Flavobacterium sp. ANB]MTD67824.1 hypothetical protein [Flavobacterium sp. LC2016-13]
MINVTLNVYGGKAPNPIKVVIDNINNTNDFYYHSKSSFNQNFDLPDGKYMMTVSGINPSSANAHTDIKVTGEFSVGPLHNDHRDVSSQFYSEIFYFEILTS